MLSGTRAWRGAAAGAAVVLALTAIEGATAARAATASWHIVKQVSGGVFGGFTAVTAVGRTGGWAFDGFSRPTAWQRSGSTWRQVTFPGQSGEQVVAAEATSATDVWAFTANGTRSRALRWNGRAWTVVKTFGQPVGGAVVLSADDVWAFGQQPFGSGRGLAAWHYNGQTWSRPASGEGLEGGSGLSARDVWAFAGTDVAHWNGRTWSRTSVAPLLPAKFRLNDPAVVGIDAQSPSSVYALGSGNAEDEGGPMVILHYDGRGWTRAAEGSWGIGTSPIQQVSSDGRGGLWIPMPGFDGRLSYLLHYAGGHVTQAALPISAHEVDVQDVALVPGTTELLGAGLSHAYNNPGVDVVAVILAYGISGDTTHQ
jgi:hypothetical protein